jgi:thiol-disulfide isomerase/thioredoxin
MKKNSKSIILLTVIIAGIIIILLTTKTDDIAEKRVTVGSKVPEFALLDTDGNKWSMSELKGRIVFLNFWATWCDTCKLEKPSIQNLINVKKGDDRFVFLSVLFKDDPANAVAFMKENNYDMTVLIDDKDVVSKFGIRGVPETFIIDSKGVVRDRIIGPNRWDSPEVIEAIARLMNE